MKQFKFCDINVCESYARNHRNRHDHARLKCKPDPTITTQIFDKIHCYFMHAYDVGYRLSVQESELLDNEYKINVDEDEFANQKFKNLKIILQTKFDKYKDILKTSENRNKHKIQQLVPTQINAKNSHQQFKKYEFGYTANYGYEGEFERKNYAAKVMERKYNSLKDELMNNKIFTLSQEFLEAGFDKAECFLIHTDKINLLNCCGDYSDICGIVFNR
eukprot:147787_1